MELGWPPSRDGDVSLIPEARQVMVCKRAAAGTEKLQTSNHLVG